MNDSKVQVARALSRVALLFIVLVYLAEKGWIS